MSIHRVIGGLIIAIGYVSSSYAIEQLGLEIEQTAIFGWQFKQLKLAVDLSRPAQAQLNLTVDQMETPAGETFRHVHVICPIAAGDDSSQKQTITCQSGTFSANHKTAGPLKGNIDLLFDPAQEKTRITISNMTVAGGKLAITVNRDQQQWRAGLTGRDLDLARLKTLIAAFITLPEVASEESGRVDLDLSAQGRSAEAHSLTLKVQIDDLAFDGKSVAENLDASLNVSLIKKGAAWQIDERLSLHSGVLYVEPGFTIDNVSPGFLIEPGKEAVTLSLKADWYAEQINIHQLTLHHPDRLTADVKGVINTNDTFSAKSLEVSLNSPSLKKLFPVYLQPLLFGSGLDELELVGKADLQIKLKDDAITDFHLVLGNVYADDKNDRFLVSGLNGDIRLNSNPDPADSTMSWRGGSIYQMNMGPGKMALASKGRSMWLREKVVIPIFDGELQIEELVMENLGLSDYAIRLDTRLTPITLGEFTETMGWPLMAGSISGQIPGLSYHQGDLAIDGVLRVRAFDGDITIRQLKIEDLFGIVPSLYADIVVDNLDLGILTQTFEFGTITGKLGGHVHDLRLEDWQPVHFEASFATPDNDRSKHRISQRAIDNITSIGGGGASSAVSRGLLGMFEEFPYSRIGLSCHLINAVCHMNGFEPTNDGYYIVKRGILPPWLDIKGYNREVDWQDMLDRLRNISKTESPVVE